MLPLQFAHADSDFAGTAPVLTFPFYGLLQHNRLLECLVLLIVRLESCPALANQQLSVQCCFMPALRLPDDYAQCMRSCTHITFYLFPPALACMFALFILHCLLLAMVTMTHFTPFPQFATTSMRRSSLPPTPLPFSPPLLWQICCLKRR